MEKIVVNGYTVAITPKAPSTNLPGAYSGFLKTETKSPKNKAENKEIINGPIIVWNTDGTCANNGTGSGQFTASETKCKSDSCNVFLENASGVCTGIWNTGIFHFNCSCDLIITGAGQTSAEGQ